MSIIKWTNAIGHVRIEEGFYSLDTGNMQEWCHRTEPMVEISNDENLQDSLILPIRLLREFLAAYDEAQKDK